MHSGGAIRGDPAVPKKISIRADDPVYQRNLEELRANTDTRWSPWRTIDGDDEQQAALAVLETIAEAWSKAMPSEPPRLVGTPGEAA